MKQTLFKRRSLQTPANMPLPNYLGTWKLYKTLAFHFINRSTNRWKRQTVSYIVNNSVCMHKQGKEPKTPSILCHVIVLLLCDLLAPQTSEATKQHKNVIDTRLMHREANMSSSDLCTNRQTVGAQTDIKVRCTSLAAGMTRATCISCDGDTGEAHKVPTNTKHAINQQKAKVHHETGKVRAHCGDGWLTTKLRERTDHECFTFTTQKLTNLKEVSLSDKLELKIKWTYHFDGFRVDVFRDDTILRDNVLDHLVQGLSLNVLPLHVRERVLWKVKEDTALLKLLHEKLFPLGRRCVLDSRQLRQLPILTDVKGGTA